MNVAIFGLGYVGVVSGSCIARDGHRVIGVDPVKEKVDAINQGRSPIVEPGLGELIQTLRQSEMISATQDVLSAVKASELIIVCVGTPSMVNGNLDLRYVHAALAEIGRALAEVDAYRVVMVRSTVLPGTVLGEALAILERESGKRAGVDFGLCFNPEFLREGTAIQDYLSPPKTVIGAMEGDERSVAVAKALYEGLTAPLMVVTIPVAEMVKYMDNTWHALKVAFGNEVGSICKKLGIDSHEAMAIFVQDTKLNLSPYYLWPGFAFGGSCLPKDVRALTYRGRSLDLSLPLLESLLPSNQFHIDRAFDMIAADGRRRIGVSGLSFKAGTDDLRESPIVQLVERLIGKGYELRIYDPDVRLASIGGANQRYILEHIRHISRLMVDTPEDLVRDCDILILSKKDEHTAKVVDLAREGQAIVDLVRAAPGRRHEESYHGICW
ncbi:MAG: nucleotide sugar dehydrogenase [Rhizomicrobium sp.]